MASCKLWLASRNYNKTAGLSRISSPRRSWESQIPSRSSFYVASLRKHANDAYQHAGLAAVYPEEAVQQALAQCHEELIERILESPLSVQETDLRAHLSAITPGLRAAAMSWRNLETHRELLPRESPDYLKELFCSNMHAMLDIIAKEGLGETISSPKVRR